MALLSFSIFQSDVDQDKDFLRTFWLSILGRWKREVDPCIWELQRVIEWRMPILLFVPELSLIQIFCSLIHLETAEIKKWTEQHILHLVTRNSYWCNRKLGIIFFTSKVWRYSYGPSQRSEQNRFWKWIFIDRLIIHKSLA